MRKISSAFPNTESEPSNPIRKTSRHKHSAQIVCWICAGILALTAAVGCCLYVRQMSVTVVEASFRGVSLCFAENAEVVMSAWERLEAAYRVETGDKLPDTPPVCTELRCRRGEVSLADTETCYQLLLAAQADQIAAADALSFGETFFFYLRPGTDVDAVIAEAEQALGALARDMGYEDVSFRLCESYSLRRTLCAVNTVRGSRDLFRLLTGEEGDTLTSGNPYAVPLLAALDNYREALDSHRLAMEAKLLKPAEDLPETPADENNTESGTSEAEHTNAASGFPVPTEDPYEEVAFTAARDTRFIPRHPSDARVSYTLTFLEEALVRVPYETVYHDLDYRMCTYVRTDAEGHDGADLVTYTSVLTADGILRQETDRNAALAPIPCEITRGIRPVTEPGSVTGSYIWPVETDGAQLTSTFGIYRGAVDDYVGYHTGYDIKVPYGSDVWAADGGLVLSSNYSSSYGYFIVIQHENNEKTLYAHLSKRLVEIGDSVYQGQVIGKTGVTGNVTATHLHFEVRVNDAWVDPKPYLADILPYEFEGWYLYVYDRYKTK